MVLRDADYGKVIDDLIDSSCARWRKIYTDHAGAEQSLQEQNASACHVSTKRREHVEMNKAKSALL
jgi:hypothetical protein